MLGLVAIIVSHNSSEDAIRCVRSLASTSVSLTRIVIIDSGSVAEHSSRLETATFWSGMVPDIIKTTNDGYAAAVNFGVHELQLEEETPLLICNADTVFQPGSADALANAVRSKQVDLVGPLLLTGARGSSRVWSRGGRLHPLLGYTSMAGRGSGLADGQKRLRQVSFLSGAVWSCRVSIFKTLGPLREDLFMYFEDAEFLLRARANNVRVHCLTSAVVWHKVGGSSVGEGRSLLFFTFMQRNRLLVFGENSTSRRLAVLLSPYTLFLTVWGALVISNRRHYLRCMARAIHDGLTGGKQLAHLRELVRS